MTYGVHVYGALGRSAELPAWRRRSTTQTRSQRSSRTTAQGDEPGMKDPDGNWDVRPHRESGARRSTTRCLRTWHALLESRRGSCISDSHGLHREPSDCAWCSRRLAGAQRIGDARPGVLAGLAREERPEAGALRRSIGGADSWSDVILQGPHIHVGNPFYKQPKSDDGQQSRLVHRWTLRRCRPMRSRSPSYKPRGRPAEVRRELTRIGATTSQSLPATIIEWPGAAWRRTLVSERSFRQSFRQALPTLTACLCLDWPDGGPRDLDWLLAGSDVLD